MNEITLACEVFKKLLEEQLNRVNNMNAEKVDFSTKPTITAARTMEGEKPVKKQYNRITKRAITSRTCFRRRKANSNLRSIATNTERCRPLMASRWESPALR